MDGCSDMSKEDLLAENARLRRELDGIKRFSDSRIDLSGEIYASIIENIGTGVLIFDKTDTITFANKAMEAIAGVERREIVGVNIIDFPKETIKEFLPIFTNARETLKTVPYYNIIVNTLANHTSYQSGMLIPRVINGAYGGMICTVEDTTDAVISSERFHTAFETSTIGMAITSPSKGWVDVNDEICRMMGYSKSELMNITWAEITHPDDIAPDVTQFNRVLNGEIDGYKLEKRFIHKDGHTIYTILWLNSKRKQDGSVEYFIAILQDVTEQKELEEELRLNSQITSNMAEGLVLIGAKDGKILLVNDRFSKMFGYDMEELVGRHISVVNAPTNKTPEEIATEIVTVIEREGYWQGEIENIRKDGTRFWCKATVSIFHHNKYGTLWISIHTDITDLKLASDDLKKSELRLTTAIEASQTGILELDLKTGQTWRTLWHDKIFGYDKLQPSWSIETLFNHVYKDDLEKVKAAVKQSRETGSPYFECRIVRSDGDIRWIRVKGGLLYDDNKEPVLMRGTVEDITDWKNREEEIKRLKESLELSLDVGGYSVWDWNIVTGEANRSDGWDKMLGYEDSELQLTKETVFGLMHPDDRDGVNKILKKHLNGQTGQFSSEMRYRQKDGTYKWMLATGRVIEWTDDNRPVRMIGIDADIDNIKGMQVRLEMELKFQTSVARISEALLSNKLDKYDISKIVYEDAMLLTQSRHCYVSVIDEDTGDNVAVCLTMMVEKECWVRQKEQHIRFSKGALGYPGLWGHSLNTKNGFYTNDPSNHPAYSHSVPKGHIPLTRFLSVPALIGNRLVGQISLANSDRDYTDNDLTIITRLASIYSIAIDRKDMEDVLRFERDRLKSFMAAMDSGIYIVNRDHDIEYINPVIHKDFGDVNGRKCYQYFHDRTESCPWCKNEEVFAGESVYWEWYSERADKHFKLYDTPIENIDGSVSKFEIFHDVTAIKKAEGLLKDFNNELERQVRTQTKTLVEINERLEKEIELHKETLKNLEESRSFLMAVLDCIEEGIVACNNEGVLTLFNRATRMFHGLPAIPIEALEWSKYYDLYKADGVTPMAMEDVPLYRTLKGEEITNVEMVIAPKDMPKLNLLATGRQLMLGDGTKIGAVASMHDITKMKEIERKLFESEQLLIQQSKMASMGEMISIIAHQWKQPLNAIFLTIQDVSDAFRFNELTEGYMLNSIKIILTQIEFMSKTVDDFRNFLRPSKEKVDFDLRLAINEILSMFSPFFAKFNIEVSMSATDDPAGYKVMGYPNEFKQVILNLLNNARDAISSQRSGGMGKITITLKNAGRKTIVSIRDNGGGIDPAILDRIFDPYFTTKTSDKGTGIGLYMSKTIIERNMDARLSARNIGDGAEFCIEFDSVR